MSFIIRVMCLDSHDDRPPRGRPSAAAGFPREALEEVLGCHSRVDHETARDQVRPVPSFREPDRWRVRLAKELGINSEPNTAKPSAWPRRK